MKSHTRSRSRSRQLSACLAASVCFGCQPSSPSTPSNPPTAEQSAEAAPASLKEAFADHFLVGVAMPASVFTQSDQASAELVKAQFNRITAENETKWKGVQATPEFDFTTADRFVEFGKTNGMQIHGHVLVWHTDQPEWLFKGEGGRPATREELLGRLKEHIDALAGRYKGSIAYWDVVNEGLEDDGTMRKSEWYTIIGEDYIEQAFTMAAAAAPDAKLVYNDYNMWMPAKRDAAVEIVKRLRSKNIRIDAIGMQGHYRTAGDPTTAHVEDAILAYKAAGVEVLISEFDIDPLPFAWDRVGADVNFSAELKAELDPYPAGFPAEAEEAQAQRYADMFRIFVKHSDVIESVTFWGVSDGASWLNTWPVKGRTNYPLLFDRQLQPKKAYHAVMAVASES